MKYYLYNTIWIDTKFNGSIVISLNLQRNLVFFSVVIKDRILKIPLTVASSQLFNLSVCLSVMTTFSIPKSFLYMLSTLFSIKTGQYFDALIIATLKFNGVPHTFVSIKAELTRAFICWNCRLAEVSMFLPSLSLE